ncbi:hypothetical protein [Desulfatitalea alkaliphila]|uniref:Uncharacterized protein n=1 Tax=Desulfatitalea alkaliphila TaxID=2929485 RepID=A0AA41UJM2_9BACT|nr:hypothetical protein [Desulfatitalea alkaliphila]MCJ8502095.1 hypothetical protein [Desulfatitalea alkaliphila]
MSKSEPDQGDTAYDAMQRRCPRLGSVVPFSYCRTDGHPQDPCFKVLDCWWERFDVATYFQQRLTPEAFQRLAQAPPPNKVASLVDLIQQARERLDNP